MTGPDTVVELPETPATGAQALPAFPITVINIALERPGDDPLESRVSLLGGSPCDRGQDP